jgi:hypothetical protein
MEPPITGCPAWAQDALAAPPEPGIIRQVFQEVDPDGTERIVGAIEVHWSDGHWYRELNLPGSGWAKAEFLARAKAALA